MPSTEDFLIKLEFFKKEVEDWFADASIAADCTGGDKCQHNFEDRPCSVQYIRRLGKILDNFNMSKRNKKDMHERN